MPLLRLICITLALSVGSVACATWEGARLYQSGSRALERGETETALRDLSAAAERVPDASEIHNHLGLARLQAGDANGALRSFEKAVELDCDNQAAAENLAKTRAQEAAMRRRP